MIAKANASRLTGHYQKAVQSIEVLQAGSQNFLTRNIWSVNVNTFLAQLAHSCVDLRRSFNGTNGKVQNFQSVTWCNRLLWYLLCPSKHIQTIALPLSDANASFHIAVAHIQRQHSRLHVVRPSEAQYQGLIKVNSTERTRRMGISLVVTEIQNATWICLRNMISRSPNLISEWQAIAAGIPSLMCYTNIGSWTSDLQNDQEKTERNRLSACIAYMRR